MEGRFGKSWWYFGIVIGVWLYSRKIKRSTIWTLDRVMVAAGLTACAIRLGNLMNSEIYGKVTNLPWGFNFVKSSEWYLAPPMGSGSMPCHPTQLYEAFVYLLVFAIAMWMYWKTNAKESKG